MARQVINYKIVKKNGKRIYIPQTKYIGKYTVYGHLKQKWGGGIKIDQVDIVSGILL